MAPSYGSASKYFRLHEKQIGTVDDMKSYGEHSDQLDHDVA